MNPPEDLNHCLVVLDHDLTQWFTWKIPKVCRRLCEGKKESVSQATKVEADVWWFPWREGRWMRLGTSSFSAPGLIRRCRWALSSPTGCWLSMQTLAFLIGFCLRDHWVTLAAVGGCAFCVLDQEAQIHSEGSFLICQTRRLLFWEMRFLLCTEA